MADPAGFFIDDEHAYAPLRALGVEVEAVPWTRGNVAWSSYSLVVIRSTWDYQDDPDAFLGVLEEIERQGVALENPLELVRWSLDKSYLRDVAARGVPIVPTVFRDRLFPGGLARLFDEVGSDQAVIKPLLSGNAQGAFRLDAGVVRERAGEIEEYYRERALIAQPFVRSVLDDGEHSLFTIDGEYSHAVLKVPKPGDFRVQEEHGGEIRAVVAGEALRRAGDVALAAIPHPALYARADFVRANDSESFWLMELELVEPSMYLRMDPGAPARFAKAIAARLSRMR